MRPSGGGKMPAKLEKKIIETFGTVEKFKEDFENFNKSSAWDLSTNILSSMILKYNYYYKDLLKEMKNVKIDMIKTKAFTNFLYENIHANIVSSYFA
jgi:hypothetical protein